ncbi:MAG: rhodanese-related sulfurtransferase [Betaproteobacteria bacterium]
MKTAHPTLPYRTFDDVRLALLERREIALLDVREEDPHAQSHPLFAANFPLARIELDAYAKLPRRDVPIVTLDDGEGAAEIAAQRLIGLGYSDVSVLAGGVSGWLLAGGELFRDVNVPSKAFGELVEAERHTPSLSAEEVLALIDAKSDVVIVDVRRFDEYHTMSIPTASSVPGAELVLRVRQLAPRPETRVIVNCAGRTRSIIGTQSLVNAGLPNPVAALRNGTIGWTLAGQKLEHGQRRTFSQEFSATDRSWSVESAQRVADLAGVKSIAMEDLRPWFGQHNRSTYFFDVRTPEEYAAGHLPGFRSVPGGQLVQETEMVAPVRGARLVLADNDGVRAKMSASWLAQMGWEVYVVSQASSSDFSELGPWQPPLPALPTPNKISPKTLKEWMASATETVVLDLTTSAAYTKAHIPGAWFILRSQLARDFQRIPNARRYVLTCGTSLLAQFVADELKALVNHPAAEVFVLENGTQGWIAAGLPSESGLTHQASDPIDRYRRPYEGTDSPKEAMQAYLDWEFGLVAQLGKDGTHHFHVV